METVYEALGGAAAVTELAVLTALWVEEWPMLADSFDEGCVLLDDSLLVAYWSHVLGGPLDQQPYDGPLYTFTGAGQDLDLREWMLEELVTAVSGMQVRTTTAHAWAAFMALVHWDVAETLDHVSPDPLLPARTVLPSWGWSGPEDVESLARQELLRDRLLVEVRSMLRPTDPVSARLEWQSSTHRSSFAERGMELVLVLSAEEPDDPCFTWPLGGALTAGQHDADTLLDRLEDWVSTATRFGWGRRVPDDR